MEGAPPSCETLVEDHLDALHGYARYRTRSADLAQELVQRAFLKAFENRHRLRNPAAARPWLLAILRNELAWNCVPGPLRAGGRRLRALPGCRSHRPACRTCALPGFPGGQGHPGAAQRERQTIAELLAVPARHGETITIKAARNGLQASPARGGVA
jgi:RNA polymerase sigma-70 factor (ECF subfamily)